jgi:hypothetical protein
MNALYQHDSTRLRGREEAWLLPGLTKGNERGARDRQSQDAVRLATVERRIERPKTPIRAGFGADPGS